MEIDQGENQMEVEQEESMQTNEQSINEQSMNMNEQQINDQDMEQEQINGQNIEQEQEENQTICQQTRQIENNKTNLQDSILMNLMPKDTQSSNVQVVIRVRPMIQKEQSDNEDSCVEFMGDNQIKMGKNTFKFDRIFDLQSEQQEVYKYCGMGLVTQTFNGYNATILAYGQTGSGKTYTMGTHNNHNNYNDVSMGILPRVIKQIYDIKSSLDGKVDVLIKVSFLEIYNEEIYDLLDYYRKNSGNANNNAQSTGIGIREEKDGQISVYGCVEKQADSKEEMMDCLQKGILNRTTSSTLMNEQSSRSHAIFTIQIEQHLIEDLYKPDQSASQLDIQQNEQQQPQQQSNLYELFGDDGFMSAKFHFVDLAGSECIKKTGAIGNIMKEGININKGLLVLGRVIAALSQKQETKQQKFVHVPYRESKLTRILQDSLGGNSKTIMIACMSPAESNFEESINTLKYANRARKIQNTPQVNRDPQSMLISQLRQEIAGYKTKLQYYQSLNGQPVDIEQIQQQMMATMKQQMMDSIQQQQQQQTLNTNNQVEVEEMRKRVTDLQIQITQLVNEKDLLKIQNAKFINIIQNLKKTHLNNNGGGGGNSNNDGGDNSNNDGGDNSNNDGNNDIRDMNINDKEICEIIGNQEQELEVLDQKNKELQKLESELNSQRIQLKQKQQQIDQLLESVQSDQLTIQSNQIQIKQLSQQLQQQQQNSSYQGRKSKHTSKQMMNSQQDFSEVDQHIKQKEKELQEVQKKNLKMKEQLMGEMKNQYYNKIVKLENEIKTVERQKDEEMKRDKQKNMKMVDGFKNKITDMQGELKDLRIKEAQQNKLKHKVDQQQRQCEQLNDQLCKFKDQKVDLISKLKQENQKFNQFKQQKQQEIVAFKKDLQVDKKLIRKLELQNNMKNIKIVKQNYQLQDRQKSQQLLSKILQFRNNMKKGQSLVNNQNQQADENVDQFIDNVILKLYQNVQNENKLQKLEKQLEIENKQSEVQYNAYQSVVMKKERLENNMQRNNSMNDEQNMIQLQNLEYQMQEEKQSMDSCNEKREFTQQQIYQLIEQQNNNQISDVEYELLGHPFLQTKEQLQILAKIILHKYLSLSSELVIQLDCQEQKDQQIEQLEKDNQYQQEQINDAYDQYFRENQEQKNMIEEMRSQHNLQLTLVENRVEQMKLQLKLKQGELMQMKMNMDEMINKQEYQMKMNMGIVNPIDNSNNNSSLNMINMLGGSTVGMQDEPNHRHTLSTDLQRSMQQSQQKGDIKIMNYKQRRQMKKPKNFKVEDVNGQQNDDANDNGSNYQHYQLDTVQFELPILEVVQNQGKMLIGTNKGLKIYNLEKKMLEYDLCYLNQQIKSIYVSDTQIVGSGDKSITIWDRNSLKTLASFKNNNYEIKDSMIIDDMLYTATTRGLMQFNLKAWNFQNNYIIDRNSDIFCLERDENMLFYGCRDHVIRCVNLKNLESLPSLDPMHYGCVNSVIRTGSYLVSASRDTNLRCWSIDEYTHNHISMQKAGDDWITQLEKQTTPQNDCPSFYSSSKDGVIKYWQIQDNKPIEISKALLQSTSNQVPTQINSLCYFQQSRHFLLVGCQDKSVRILYRN